MNEYETYYEAARRSWCRTVVGVSLDVSHATVTVQLGCGLIRTGPIADYHDIPNLGDRVECPLSPVASVRD